MNAHRQISNLWMAFQNAIDLADNEGRKLNNADGHAQCNALHDYTKDRNWRMANLLRRETANERQHRRGGNNPVSFSVSDAAKLQIMQWAAFAADLNVMPSAHLFLTMRPTAVEAEVVGFLCRAWLNKSWRDELATLDYTELMHSKDMAETGYYRTFKRSAKNWEQFARARKITVQTGLTYEQAREMCRDSNDNRTQQQIHNGTKMEFERQ